MQLPLALLASAALAVACLPTQDRQEKSKKDTDGGNNVSESHYVYPVEVKFSENGTAPHQVVSTKTERSAAKTVSTRKPKMIATYRKPPTKTTTERTWDFYDYYSNDDPTKSKMTHGYDKPPPLCPGDGFMCKRDCESQNFYAGYCEGNQCICYGKLSG